MNLSGNENTTEFDFWWFLSIDSVKIIVDYCYFPRISYLVMLGLRNIECYERECNLLHVKLGAFSSLFVSFRQNVLLFRLILHCNCWHELPEHRSLILRIFSCLLYLTWFMEPEDSLPRPENPRILCCLEPFEFNRRNSTTLSGLIFNIFLPFSLCLPSGIFIFENFRPIYSVGSSFPYAIYEYISRQFHER
jgi:hypothetical protein